MGAEIRNYFGIFLLGSQQRQLFKLPDVAVDQTFGFLQPGLLYFPQSSAMLSA